MREFGHLAPLAGGGPILFSIPVGGVSPGATPAGGRPPPPPPPPRKAGRGRNGPVASIQSHPALLAAVDLAAHQRDGALIDRGRVPGLDGGEIRLAGLVPRAGPPAMGFWKVPGR